MALDPGDRPMSPASSGRSSPVPRALPRRPVEDGPLKKDKVYRRYAAGIDKALSLFDTTQQEWADYISFLGRLLKALQAHPHDKHDIPYSDVLATRLSQCLNPTLPSGVHQKALEVYDYVFNTVSKDVLSQDLAVYFPGLAPVLSFASLSVRPAFLSLLEQYVLALDAEALRPALKSIILSLLPGLEDETSEDFEHVLRVVDKLRIAVRGIHASDEDNESKDSFFWQCFFLGTITNSSRRQGALAFLMRKLPKFNTTSDRKMSVASENGKPSGQLSVAAQAAISPEPGLLIRCFAAGLQDKQLLVQRGFLDLLVTHIPLDSPVLQSSINEIDLQRLVAAAASVVGRRDMSLNRRLWAWFLGPEPKAGAEDEDAKSPLADPSSYHANYFARYGLQALSSSILKLLSRPNNLPAERGRPFRICLSLMDRWEVGGLIVPEIFVPALQSVFDYSKFSSKDNTDEVVRSASNFFDGVESSLIWNKIVEMLVTALEPGKLPESSRTSSLDLCFFLINRFNIREEEMVLHHIPLATLALLTSLKSNMEYFSSPTLNRSKMLETALRIADALVQLIPKRALIEGTDDDRAVDELLQAKTKSTGVFGVTNAVREYYGNQHGGSELSNGPFQPRAIGQLLLRTTTELFVDSLEASFGHGHADSLARILCSLIYKVPAYSALLGREAFLSAIENKLKVSNSRPTSFPQVSAVITVIAALETASSEEPFISPSQMHDICHPLARTLWFYLSPQNPKFHVEAARCLWQLEAITEPKHYIESSIASFLNTSQNVNSSGLSESPATSARRFAVLWTHSVQEKTQGQTTEKARGSVTRRVSGGVPGTPGIVGSNMNYKSMLTRPLLVLLDSLREEGTELFAYTRSWLQDLPSLIRVFDILLVQIRATSCLQGAIRGQKREPNDAPRTVSTKDDTLQFLYYLQHVYHILKWPSESIWMTLAGESVPSLVSENEDHSGEVTLQTLLVDICMTALDIKTQEEYSDTALEIQRMSLLTLQQILRSPFASPLQELELEAPLLRRLHQDLRGMDASLQTALLESTSAALKLRMQGLPVQPESPTHARKMSYDTIRRVSRLSLTERTSKEMTVPSIPPPPLLVECLRAGFSNPSSFLIMDYWVNFLVEVLPMFADTIFQSLIPLVECFCSQIKTVFGQMKSAFEQPVLQFDLSPEPTLISLMNGLEQVLARAHDRLVNEEMRAATAKSPEQPQGFFGNMVSNVFASEAQPSRSATANSRLTVVLCFQDTLRIAFAVWSWGGLGLGSSQDPTSNASFGYTSLRMRNRARRVLEHLFAAEALECLEALAVIWCRSSPADVESKAVMSVLHVLNGSRPKHTMPAIFNAVYSRTSPQALEPSKLSTLTSDLLDTDLVAFLVEYTRTLEDDAMDEIWTDCMTFLRDVLANPLPHRQILPALLEFTTLLAEKVENTNFGEERKMRKELGDLFMRLLFATFTTRPSGLTQEQAPATSTGQGATHSARGADYLAILLSVVGNLPVVLVDADRITNVATQVSTSLVGPALRSKTFPENVSPDLLTLLLQLSRAAPTAKSWRKDAMDAFNDSRFFAAPLSLIKTHWLPVLAQLNTHDKSVVPDLLSRLTAPTTAGIMFGVGANSARLEADRRTQLNLRRMALLILACPDDTFIPHVPALEEKLVELLTANPASSPSSATRAELYMLIRALLLKLNPIHLSPLWPVLNAELSAAIAAVLPDRDGGERFNAMGVLQACKVLDLLEALQGDEWQLREWTFVTDTIDVVYRPPGLTASALTEEVAEELMSAYNTPETPTTPATLATGHFGMKDGDDSTAGLRRPILDGMIMNLKEQGVDVQNLSKQDVTRRLLRPFLGQLGIIAYEATYGMAGTDVEACVEGVLGDLCEEGGA
ncbi:hypothetical protein K402DRAFT_419717 [Aulographum hederae CBS 113979]|uniref:Uncharacterized protein n=1 Tax=Aulographum hederae CBS 113979 TaxID=1176131 RepID=A0A6G1H5G2_9PEZI|nr:hypothetical protein K402DRAFT_419717 [Aulographum hederae CBS 113979]